ALHTGGCRIYIDNNIVLDDWSGTGGSGRLHNLNEGLHEVKVEFKQEERVPAPGVKGYYRAALNFGWSKDEWAAKFYKDKERKLLSNVDDPKPDHNYMIWRTLTLTGDPIFQRRYAASHSVAGEYQTSDGVPLV